MRLISERKVRKIASSLDENGLDAALFINFEPFLDPNIPYITGMHGMLDGALILDNEKTKLIVTELDRNRAETDASVDEIIQIKKGDSLFSTIRAHAKEYKRIGVNKSILSLKASEILKLKSRSDDIGTFMAMERAVKEEKEIEAVRESARITNKGISFLKGVLSDGFTERETVSKLECELKFRGSEKPAFETIMTSGRRSAFIHPYPGASGKKVGKGPGIVDFGSVYMGYHTDVTVPFISGHMSAETERMHNAIETVWKQIRSVVKHGVKVSSLHEIYKKTLEEHGYDIRHSLGHGIGLQIHEYPSLSSEDAVLKKGMTIAVEPGVYSDSIGGLRLENDILIEKNGFEMLTKSKLIRL